MPYGIAKSLGGDNPENDAHVERMVGALMKQGRDKVSAIRIAKASMHPKLKGKTSDPRLAGLQDLHSMLSEAIATKLKAKKSAKLDRSKAKADADDTELGASGEAADETDPRVQRRKVQFGRGGK